MDICGRIITSHLSFQIAQGLEEILKVNLSLGHRFSLIVIYHLKVLRLSIILYIYLLYKMNLLHV